VHLDHQVGDDFGQRVTPCRELAIPLLDKLLDVLIIQSGGEPLRRPARLDLWGDPILTAAPMRSSSRARAGA